MRILFFLILSSFLLSQSAKDTTDIKEVPSTIPVEVKPAVKEIVTNSEEARKAASELDKEMKKQLDLMKQIKSKISQIKKQSSPKKKIEKVTPIPSYKGDSITPLGIKPNDIQIQVNGQLIKYEPRKTTIFGKVIHTAYYPYIQDEKGRRIYLK